MSTWTPEHAAEWEAVWKSPIMERGLLRLKDRCRVSGKPQDLPAGYDALVLAAQAFSHAQGASSVFEMIEEMKSRKTAAMLPQPFEVRPKPEPAPEE